MSEAVQYRIADEVHRELFHLRNDLRNYVNLSIMTTAKAKETYWKRVHEIMRDARIETNTEEMMLIQCSYCKEISQVKRDVRRFECRCMPSISQYTFQCRACVA